MRSLFTIVPIMTALVDSAWAQRVMTPVTGAKIVVISSRVGNPGRLVFESRDPTLPFPDPGLTKRYGLVMAVWVPSPTPDDPYYTENFTFEQAQVSSYWRYQRKPRERLVYVNPNPGSTLRTKKIVVTRHQNGRKLRWYVTRADLDMTAPLRWVGVHIDYWYQGQVVCALFDASSVIEDLAGRFIAKAAPRPLTCGASADAMLQRETR
jgi:hypothetical protein